MSDQRTRTLVNLYIRDRLYVVYEEMAREMGCSVDYLVNEAMRNYAQKHNMSGVEGEEINAHRSDLSDDSSGMNVDMQPIFLWFNGQRNMIDISRFIIGRGGDHKRCDLVIADHNISRQHCAVVYVNGEHYIQDLKSTNGIEYKQEKVLNKKKINEGDVFYLCDYPIYFTYQLDRTFTK